MFGEFFENNKFVGVKNEIRCCVFSGNILKVYKRVVFFIVEGY